MKKTILILTLFVGLVLVSCQNETPKFVGEWKLEKMDLAGEVIYANALGSPKYIFFDDNSYAFKIKAESETGKWSLKNDIITLVSKDSDEKKELKIIEVTDQKFVYQVGDDVVSTVSLTK